MNEEIEKVEAPQLGVGESDQEQKAPESPLSTVARKRMQLIIKNNQTVMEDSRKVLSLLEADPALDASFCRLFGITEAPQTRDVF